MNPMEKMMLEEKNILKEKILKLFDSLNKDNFIEEVKTTGCNRLRELGSIHSYSIDLEFYDTVIFIYLDGKLSLKYEF